MERDHRAILLEQSETNIRGYVDRMYATTTTQTSPELLREAINDISTELFNVIAVVRSLSEVSP